MAKKTDEPDTTAAVCPICQGPAVRGTLLASGKLQWYPGPPTLKKKIVSKVLMTGKFIGKVDILFGLHIEGVRCRSCKRLILEE